MENDDPLLLSYKFFFDGGLNNVYYFSTVNSIAYEVQFKPSPYVFNETAFSNDVFELVLKVIDAPEGVRPPFDSCTEVTVATIVKDF